MLRRMPAIDISQGRVTRTQSHIVVVMRFYPRFLPKDLRDEYIRELAPPDALFKEFKERQRKLNNHNQAFDYVHYERRFTLTPAGLKQLAKFAELARTQDVVLVCQCRDFERCHCDLLLLIARARWGAEIRGPIFSYPEFEQRLAEGEFKADAP